MTLHDILLLAGAGLLAGAVNALAGGGTIFSFSALLATGLPAVTANATSAVSVVPGQIAATLTYHREIAAHFRRLLPFTLASGLGGIAGGILLLRTDEGAFTMLVPWLILFATVLFMLAPRIAALGQKLSERRRRTAGTSTPGPTILQGIVGIYGGYFGAGMGIMMLATLSLTEGRDFHRLNAVKNWLACVMQGLAVIIFIVSGRVDWASVAIVAIASIVGGWGSAVIGRFLPQPAIRGFVIVTGLGLSLWYFLT